MEKERKHTKVFHLRQINRVLPVLVSEINALTALFEKSIRLQKKRTLKKREYDYLKKNKTTE